MQLLTKELPNEHAFVFLCQQLPEAVLLSEHVMVVPDGLKGSAAELDVHLAGQVVVSV